MEVQPQPNLLSEPLGQRYQTLYEQYGQEEGVVTDIKQAIDDWQDQTRNNRLREDAKFFLIVNSHQMIYKAYAASLHKTDTDKLLPTYLNEDDTNSRIQESLEVILTDLEDKPQPISGHEVMKSIDRNWEKLKNILIWS